MSFSTEAKIKEFGDSIKEFQAGFQSIANEVGKEATKWIECYDRAIHDANPITKICLKNHKEIAEFIAAQPARTEKLLSDLTWALRTNHESNFNGLLKGKKLEELPRHHVLLLNNTEKNILGQIGAVVQGIIEEAKARIGKTKNKVRDMDLLEGSHVAKSVILSTAAVLAQLKTLYLIYEAAEMAHDFVKEKTPYGQIKEAAELLDLQSNFLSDLLKICSALHRVPNGDDLRAGIAELAEKEAIDRLRLLMPDHIRDAL